MNSNYIKIIKQTQTPPSQKDSMSASMKIEKYREWRDVDKCLNASLDQNYKDLLHMGNQAVRSDNNSCFTNNRTNVRKSGRAGPGLFDNGQRFRFAERTHMTLADT